MLDSNLNVTIIDLGFASKFMESKDEHKNCMEVSKFEGNLLFSSTNQMNFITTSRRDDLQSACLILLTILN